jgi:hypothetical protein
MNTIEQKTEEIVNELVKNGFMFTGYDVTCLVRKDLGANTPVSHSEVNTKVKQLFSQNKMQSYVKDSIGCGGKYPFLYFHPSNDIQNYELGWIQSNPTQKGIKTDITKVVNPTNTVSPVNTVKDPNIFSPPSLDISPDDDFKKKVKLTKESRLNIPTEFSKSINANDCYIKFLNDSSFIISLSYKGDKLIKNSDGRLRLGRKYLKNIKDFKSKEYIVELKNDEILVKAN